NVGTPASSASFCPAVPARSEPTATICAPYSGSLHASSRAAMLLPAPDMRTTTRADSVFLPRVWTDRRARVLPLPGAPGKAQHPGIHVCLGTVRARCGNTRPVRDLTLSVRVASKPRGTRVARRPGTVPLSARSARGERGRIPSRACANEPGARTRSSRRSEPVTENSPEPRTDGQPPKAERGGMWGLFFGLAGLLLPPYGVILSLFGVVQGARARRVGRQRSVPAPMAVASMFVGGMGVVLS